MIEATIRRSRNDGGILSFEMTGHADFAEHGRDLVCAGVTAVVFGAVNAVIALAPLEPILDIGEDGVISTLNSLKLLIRKLCKKRSC